MTDISITVPAELNDDWVSEGKIVLDAAKQAWLSLPKHIRTACKKVRVNHAYKNWGKSDQWSIHFIFQVRKLPEFAIMYHTGGMGVPQHNYNLMNFSTEQLAKILINGQPRCRDREETFGILSDIKSEIQRLAAMIDEKSQILLEFSPPELEVREILGPNSDLVLVRSTNTLATPDLLEELCNRSGYKILGHDLVVTFEKVLGAKLAAVTDLAAIQNDRQHGHCMCVCLRNEDHPRYNVWTNGTGVWEQAISSDAWFIVKSAD
jgi:hypothetical protein